MKLNKTALGLSLLVLTGCYTRHPLVTTPPPPNTRLVATLTDSGTVAMGNALGQGAVEIEGIVTNAVIGEWTMQMLRVDHRDGRSIGWNHEVVSFPQRALVNPTVVVLDKRKSWLIAGAIAIGAFLAAQTFDVFGADELEDNTPQPQASKIGGIRR